jgi:quercetin dioxygenase-like cupin family protein
LRAFGRGSGSRASPTILLLLETVDGARAIIVRLGAGEELGDHQVRERAWLMVVEGTARIEAGGDVVDAGPGTLLTLEPGDATASQVMVVLVSS